MTGSPTYEGQLGDEVLQLSSKVTIYITSCDISKNLHLTPTVSYFYLITIQEIIRGCVAVLKVRSLSLHHIAVRSLMEFLLDLMLISIRDDQRFNQRFATFHRLSVFSKRELIDTRKDQIPRARSDYYDELMNVYEEIIVQGAKRKDNILMPDWPAVHKRASRLARASWTGLSFIDKLKAVTIEYIDPESVGSGHKEWSRIESRLKEADPEQWNNRSFNEKNELVAKEVQKTLGKVQKGLDELDHCIRNAFMTWGLLSEYTHPSPRSTVPNYAIQEGTFELQYNASDSQLRLSEEFLFLVLGSAAYAASSHLSKKGEPTLRNMFDKWTSQTSLVQDWLRE